MVSVTKLEVRSLAERLDPELRASFEANPPLDPSLGPAGIRARLAEILEAFPQAPSPTVDRRDVTVAGPAGDLRVRVYEPHDRDGVLPGILFVHGGGFVAGTIDETDGYCERLVENVGAVVVSVDYRLAPEHPFPAAIEDCHAALSAVSSGAEEFGVDPERIAAVGTSAGGGLVAGLSLLARDRGEPHIAFQMPLCATLDDRHGTPSSREITDARTWNRQLSLDSWRAYLGDTERADVSPYAASARAADLSGLPPTFLSVGGCDLLRDENLGFASRLVRAGVPTELHLYPGAHHAFEILVPTAQVSREALHAQERALRRALHAHR